MNGLNFFAERYTKIARNLYVWGSFKFTMDRESERAWSDVILERIYKSLPIWRECKGKLR